MPKLIIHFCNLSLQDHDGAIVSELVIDRVHEQHFRRYWFIAENTLGSTELVINVEEGNSV